MYGQKEATLHKKGNLDESWTLQCAKWKKDELGSWTMQAYSLTDDAIF